MLSQVRARGARYPHILTDYFDTLVFRRVHPFEVLKIWACQVRAPLGVRCSAAELYAIRMATLDAVGPARPRPAGVFPPLSYTYREWLSALRARLAAASLLPPETPFEEFLRVSLEIEERVELLCQYPNERAVEVLAEWRAAGKKLHVVSDFYMPRRSIARALEHFGLAHLFDNVFVSGDLGATKQDGSLYPLVLGRLGVRARDAFMFGDNHRCDVLNARAAGIAAVQIRHRHNALLPKIRRRLLGTGSTRDNFSRAFREHERACRRSGAPFCEYVLAYYFFTERLFFRLRELRARHVVFLAREGFLLRQFFEAYQDARAAPELRVSTHYLRMSRQSATLLRLRPLDTETFPHITAASARDFLGACGFDEAQIARLATELSGSLTRVEPDFKRSECFRRLLASERFRELYARNIETSREAFRRYFAGFNLAAGDEVVVVDIGWTGRMQDALAEVSGLPARGLYLGLRRPASLTMDTPKEGLIFSTVPRRSPYYDSLDINRQIYEQLLMAPHGGVVSYALGEDGSCIINEDYRRAEREVFQGSVAPVQQAMLAAFRRLLTDPRLHCYEDEWLLRHLARMGVRSGVFAGAGRRRFLREISRGFVDNFAAVKVGVRYTPALAGGGKPAGGTGGGSTKSAGGGGVSDAPTLRQLLLWPLRPAPLSRYMVKVCTLENPLVRWLLTLFLVLPWYVRQRFDNGRGGVSASARALPVTFDNVR
ncbi:MAG: HAD family hydrolase [Puniceicoccales bacterium]|jgi:FMN phosphatase YigB (HAD superfamily)|nr:HAD family hydrolase [Puniceicoccales bacterium]